MKGGDKAKELGFDASVERWTQLERNPEKWSALLDWELEASASPGNIEGGVHKIVVAGKIGNERAARRDAL